MPHGVELGGGGGWEGGRAGPPGLLGTQAQSCALQCDPPGTLWELLGFLLPPPLVPGWKPYLWIFPD